MTIETSETTPTYNDDPTKIMSSELLEAYREIRAAHELARYTGVRYATNSDELKSPDIQQHGVWWGGPHYRESYHTATSRIQHNYATGSVGFALAEIKPGIVVPPELAPEDSLEAEIVTAVNEKNRPVSTLGFNIYDSFDADDSVTVDELIFNEDPESAAKHGVNPVQLLDHSELVHSNEEYDELLRRDPEAAAKLDLLATQMVYPESELLGRRLTPEELTRANVFIAKVATQEIIRAVGKRSMAMGQQALASIGEA